MRLIVRRVRKWNWSVCPRRLPNQVCAPPQELGPMAREITGRGAADLLAWKTGSPATCIAKKEANRLRHAFIRSIRLERTVPSSTIARSTAMAHSALREGNTEEIDGEPRQRAIDDSGKAERRNLPTRCWALPRTTARHTAVLLEVPFRHSPEHRRTPASCELAAEQVTNAASA